MTTTKMRTPLARARGLGSARDGTHHFWVHRLSALALAPLCLWFCFEVLSHMGDSYEQFRLWVSSLPVACALVATIIMTFWHAGLGLQTVVEDYFHNPLRRLIGLLIVKYTCFACGVVGVVAVLKISIGA